MHNSPQSSTTTVASRLGSCASNRVGDGAMPLGACAASGRGPRAASTVARAAAALAGVLAALLALALLGPGAAHADQMTVYSCHDPAGEAVGHAGWAIERTAQPYMSATDTCSGGGQGALGLGLGASPYGYSNGARVEWVFHSPAWAQIAGYRLQLAGSYARPSSGGGSGQAFVDDSGESDPNYAYRNLGGGGRGGASVVRNPSAPVGRITVDASCDGEDGPCPAGAPIASVQVSSASIVLDDLSTPTAGDLTGSLLSAKQLSGTAEVSFQAHDEGPGLYSAWLVVDGQAQPATLLDPNAGSCHDLGPAAQTARSFGSPTPCARSASASLALNTAGLPDGRHPVKLMVDDAAGNATLAWSASIETENAPIVASPPSIAGAAKIGQTLTATPAVFSAPEGAGPLSEEGGRWLRCTGTAAGECAPIAGASKLTYTPTSEDAGYRLLYRSSASDRDGLTRSDSPPTPVLSEPAASPTPPSGGSGGGSGGGGSAGSSSGGSSSGGSTGGQSAGQSGGEGIARTVEIVTGGSGGAGGAGGSAQSTAAARSATGSVSARLGAARHGGGRRDWGLGLRMRRRRVRRGVRVRIIGGVRGGTPQARGGRLVYLRVRSVWSVRRHGCAGSAVSASRCHHRRRRGGRHRRYGRWVTLLVLRTRADGLFASSHVFRLHGRRIRWQIQAVAPGVGGGAARRSRILTVREGRAGGWRG